MPNNESVGKKIVEALKKQAENMDIQDDIQADSFDTAPVTNPINDDIFSSTSSDDFFAEPAKPVKNNSFFE